MQVLTAKTRVETRLRPFPGPAGAGENGPAGGLPVPPARTSPASSSGVDGGSAAPLNTDTVGSGQTALPKPPRSWLLRDDRSRPSLPRRCLDFTKPPHQAKAGQRKPVYAQMG